MDCSYFVGRNGVGIYHKSIIVSLIFLLSVHSFSYSNHLVAWARKVYLKYSRTIPSLVHNQFHKSEGAIPLGSVGTWKVLRSLFFEFDERVVLELHRR